MEVSSFARYRSAARSLGGEDLRSSFPAVKGPRSLSDFSGPLEKLRFSPDPSDPPEDLSGLRYPFGLTPFQGRGPRSYAS
jgi:hypothetical protein